MAERRRFESARRALSLAHERHTSLCEPFLSVLPVSGASVSVLASPVGQSTMCASSPVAARLDELQFDLGEGPCWQALSTRLPVIAPDLRTGPNAAWPVFAEAVLTDTVSRDVAAMFAFPLKIGTLDIGAVDLWVERPSTLTRSQVADASALASVAAWQVLRRILEEQAMDAAEDDSPSTGSRREVHQATGMILAQLNVSAQDAALLLRAYAFSSGRSVRDLAADIVARRLDFSPAANDSSGEAARSVVNDDD